MNKCFGYIFFYHGRESDLYIQTIASLLIYFQKIIKQLSAVPFSKTVIFNLKILLFFFKISNAFVLLSTVFALPLISADTHGM